MFDDFVDESIEINTENNPTSNKRVLELTMRKIKEDNNMINKKRVISVPFVAAVAAVMISVSAVAAHQILLPKDVAMRMEDDKLAEVFTSDDTRFDSVPQKSGDYTFDVLGIASGKGLSKFTDADENKSYIVSAVVKNNGEKFSDYPGIMVTPLVSGYKPWEVNIFTMGGGKYEFISNDGYVDYFITECDNIEIFADHTVYIAMYEESKEFGMAPGSDIFSVNNDGTIKFADDFKKANALFTVPIDKSKADPKAVKKLLESNDNNESGDSDVSYGNDAADCEVIIGTDENGDFTFEEVTNSDSVADVDVRFFK